MDQFCNDLEKEVLGALVRAGVSFIIIGGAAVQFHGYQRPRDDLDILVEPTPENAARFSDAVSSFVGKGHNATLMAEPGQRFAIDAPYFVEFLSSINTISFDEAQAGSVSAKVAGVKVHVLGLDELIVTKQGRAEVKDLNDVRALEPLA